MSGKHSKDTRKKQIKKVNDDRTKRYTKVNAKSTKISDETKAFNMKTNKKKDKKVKGKGHKVLKRILLVILLFILVAIIAVLVVIIAAVAVITAIFKTDKWAITKEDLLSDAGATIYNEDGTEEILTLTGDEINKKVSLEDMGVKFLKLLYQLKTKDFISIKVLI